MRAIVDIHKQSNDKKCEVDLKEQIVRLTGNIDGDLSIVLNDEKSETTIVIDFTDLSKLGYTCKQKTRLPIVAVEMAGEDDIGFYLNINTTEGIVKYYHLNEEWVTEKEICEGRDKD